MDKQYRVLTVEVTKTGEGTGKNGQPYTWSIKKVSLDGYSGEVTGFDEIAVGDMVTLETKQNGKYTNTNYVKVSADGNTPSAPTTSADKRTIKLLVAIADALGQIQAQVGVPDELQLTKEAIAEILES